MGARSCEEDHANNMTVCFSQLLLVRPGCRQVISSPTLSTIQNPHCLIRLFILFTGPFKSVLVASIMALVIMKSVVETHFTALSNRCNRKQNGLFGVALFVRLISFVSILPSFFFFLRFPKASVVSRKKHSGTELRLLSTLSEPTTLFTRKLSGTNGQSYS